MAMPKILLIQGPSMSYLGRRRPELCGRTSAAELDAIPREHARANRYALAIFHAHSEGEAIERLYPAVDEGLEALLQHLRSRRRARPGRPPTRRAR